MQLLNSDWPANILAGLHYWAQEIRALSPDGVCELAQARLGTRLGLVVTTGPTCEFQVMSTCQSASSQKVRVR